MNLQKQTFLLFLMLFSLLILTQPIEAEQLLIVFNNETFSQTAGANYQILSESFQQSEDEFKRNFGADCTILESFTIASAVLIETSTDRAVFENSNSLITDVIPITSKNSYRLPKSNNDLSGRAVPPYSSWVLPHLGIETTNHKFGLLGEGVTIGMIDTGVNPDHIDLKGKICLFRDFVNQQTEAYDDNGHGTFTAGILCGDQRVGCAPKANLLVVKAINQAGYLSIANGLAAMDFLANPDGDSATDDFPRIINCSFNNPDNSDKAFYQATLNLRKLGILTVFPTREDGSVGVGTPAGYPHVISVGGTTQKDTLSYFTGYGKSPFDNKPKPTLVAPAEWLFSTTIHPITYTMKDGTDFSCAYVSAILALALSATPDLSCDTLQNTLLSTCRNPENSWKFGAGLPQADKFLTTLLQPTSKQFNFVDTSGKPVLVSGTINSSKAPFVNFTFTQQTIELPMAEGQYLLQANCFGYKGIKHNFSATQNQLTITMEKKTRVKFALELKNSTGEPLNGTITFLGKPGENQFLLEGNTLIYPEAGEHNVLLSAFGYQDLETKIKFQANGKQQFILKLLPSLLLIDDDGPVYSIPPVAKALTVAGIPHRIYRPSDMGEVQFRLLSQYQTVYWHLGPRLGQTLSESDMNAISKFVNNGGNLLLTGQDIAYKLQYTSFLREYLGTIFVRDNSIIDEIYGSDDYPEFTNWFSYIIQSGANTGQLSCDVIARSPDSDDVRELLYFGPKDGFRPGAAAVINRGMPGTVIFCSFGLEGIPELEHRVQLLTSFFGEINQHKSVLKSLTKLQNDRKNRQSIPLEQVRLLQANILQAIRSGTINKEEYQPLLDCLNQSDSALRSLFTTLRQEIKTRLLIER